MNKSRINEWLTIATNVAVLAGIIFLAIEIRQNSIAIRSGVLQAVSSESSPLNLALAANATMRETWILGLQNPNALTESQRLQFHTTMHVWFSNAQNWYYQATSGVLDDEIADGHWTTMATMHSTSPGFRQYWESRAYLYTPAFREFVTAEVLTRETLQAGVDLDVNDFGHGAKVQAITKELDDLFSASQVQGTVDTMLRSQLAFFAPQPTIQPPGEPAIVGQESVAKFYRDIFDAEFQILENKYTDLTVVVDADMATRQYIGEGLFKIGEAAAPLYSKNRYFDVLIEKDGEWKILLHSWQPEGSAQ